MCNNAVKSAMAHGDSRHAHRNDRLGVLLLLLLYQEVMQNLDHMEMSIHESDHFVNRNLIIVICSAL
jgi:hypothetical protein